MFGIFLAALSCCVLILGDAGKKRILNGASVLQVTWVFLAIGVGALLAILPWFYPASPAWARMLVYLPWSIVLMLVGELFFMRALRDSEYSLITPLFALIPVFAIPISYLMLGEYPSPPALIGVGVATIGAYVLGMELAHTPSFWAPLKAFLGHGGARSMLVALLIAPVLGSLQKLGASAGDSFLFLVLTFLGEFVIISCVLLVRRERPFHIFTRAPLDVTVTGLLWIGGLTALMLSFEYTLVSYVAAVRLVQPLLGLLVGWLVFKEQNVRGRILPALLMILGVSIIVLVAIGGSG